jgi:hypothetical protein
LEKVSPGFGSKACATDQALSEAGRYGVFTSITFRNGSRCSIFRLLTRMPIHRTIFKSGLTGSGLKGRYFSIVILAAQHNGGVIMTEKYSWVNILLLIFLRLFSRQFLLSSRIIERRDA